MDPGSFELHIPSSPGSEKEAMQNAARVARGMGFSEDRVQDLMTAVSEACINAMEHGNKMDSKAMVGVSLRTEDKRLEVSVRDEGAGGDIETIKAEAGMPDMDSKIDGTDDRKRGWGIFLINQLMDEVEFLSDKDSGNVVKMVIHLEKP